MGKAQAAEAELCEIVCLDYPRCQVRYHRSRTVLELPAGDHGFVSAFLGNDRHGNTS